MKTSLRNFPIMSQTGKKVLKKHSWASTEGISVLMGKLKRNRIMDHVDVAFA